jgi:autotransporter-associated beta strand protein
MKHNPHNSLLAAVTVAGFAIAALLAAPSAHAAALTWDTVTGDGGAITAGSGAWNITAGNLVWNDGTTPNVIWSQTSTTDGSNTATFAGTDGATDAYVITLAAQMAAESITFNSSGYQITGGTLALMPTTATNGAITVAAGKTATINSTLRYVHNVAASVVVGSGSVLNLGGGTTASNNPQFAFSGAGTVNITAGTYASNIGSIGNATFNQTGGTYNITPGNGAGFNITSATQNVAYNLSAGTLSVNGNNTTANGVSNAHLGIGNGTSTFTSTLAVSGTGIMQVGTTAGTYGEIRIGNATASNGTLNVSGGTVTVGTGGIGNKIYFFKNGSDAGYTATMTQSGGTVTTNGIQFGTTTGTYSTTSAANLTLSGGSLYVGDRGIIRGGGTAVESLPVTIKLQGGTLGANQNWSSPLDMKLGTATIRAQDAASNGRNITLSGILSNDSGAGTLTTTGTGTLTLSGNNTYSGGSTLGTGVALSGTVNIGHDSALGTGKIISKGALIQASGGDRVLTNAVDVDAGGFRFGGINNLTFNGVLTPIGALRTIENTTGNRTLTLAGGISNALGVAFDGNAGNVANGSFVVSGAISGDGGVSTTADFQNGVLALTAANTYTGATTVNAGTLYVSGALANSAATVGATGTIGSNGGAGSLGNGLTIAAGGTLDLTGATLGANSSGILSLTGGSLTLGNLTFQNLVGWDWLNAAEGTYELIDGSFSVDFGTTAYLDAGSAYDFGNGKRGYFTQGSLNAVIIPEPRAALLGGLGLLALLRRRRN